MPTCHVNSFQSLILWLDSVQNGFVNCKITKNKNQTEICSGLPPDVSHLKTDTSFPVSYGTGVTVSCSEDRELRGDGVITCDQGTEFRFQDKPSCNDIGKCGAVSLSDFDRKSEVC